MSRKPKKLKDPYLTKRQLQCLILAAKGKNDREIASKLRLSDRTVHEHFEIAKAHFGARTRVQLVVRALATRQMKLRQVAK